MSESPARKPAVIRKRFPLGWLVLALLVVIAYRAAGAAAQPILQTA